MDIKERPCRKNGRLAYFLTAIMLRFCPLPAFHPIDFLTLGEE
jgi:hypothetical protein